jgi:hypothetical protein
MDGDVKLQDDTFLLIPELRTLYEKHGSKYIRYVILMCDYKSPYRQLILTNREREVCFDVWGEEKEKVKHLDSELVIKAKEKYKKLQYDPTVEQYLVYTEKISEYNQFLREMPIAKDNAEMLSRVMKAVKDITEAREELKDLILKKEEESKMMGGGEASLLEEMLG